MALTVQNGSLVVRDGALATGQGCCCGGGCCNIGGCKITVDFLGSTNSFTHFDWLTADPSASNPGCLPGYWPGGPSFGAWFFNRTAIQNAYCPGAFLGSVIMPEARTYCDDQAGSGECSFATEPLTNYLELRLYAQSTDCIVRFLYKLTCGDSQTPPSYTPEPVSITSNTTGCNQAYWSCDNTLISALASGDIAPPSVSIDCCANKICAENEDCAPGCECVMGNCAKAENPFP